MFWTDHKSYILKLKACMKHWHWKLYCVVLIFAVVVANTFSEMQKWHQRPTVPLWDQHKQRQSIHINCKRLSFQLRFSCSFAVALSAIKQAPSVPSSSSMAFLSLRSRSCTVASQSACSDSQWLRAESHWTRLSAEGEFIRIMIHATCNYLVS